MFARGDQPSAFSPEDRDAPAPRPSDAPPDTQAPALDPGTHSTDFVHQLRNRLFAMSALFDVLELRGAGSPVVERYLPHLRLELSRLENFAADWTENVLADATAESPSLIDALATAIARVSEHAALREVLVSLVSEPEVSRNVSHPVLVTATFALLLDEVVRTIPTGSHVWFRVGHGERGEATVELFAPGAPPLEGAGVELARATLHALGGALAPGPGDRDGALAIVLLGAPA